MDEVTTTTRDVRHYIEELVIFYDETLTYVQKQVAERFPGVLHPREVAKMWNEVFDLHIQYRRKRGLSVPTKRLE